MIIYPAIDISKSKCVRLYQGDYTRETIYHTDPIEKAKQFHKEGATWVHIVDLDAAENPESNQLSIISEIIKNVDIKVQTGGGIRSKEQIKNLLNMGAERVIIGSMTVTNPNEVAKWLTYFGPDRIVLAMDVIHDSNNHVMITSNAWKRTSKYSLFDMIVHYESYGLTNILCTNISLDGTLKGPDFKLYTQFIKRYPYLCLQASGGICSLDDIKTLCELGLSGAIVGRALYENKFTLPEVLRC